MIKVRRIRYATFETPDLEKALAYYTQVNGLAVAVREKDRAFLATSIGELAIELQQGQKARCLGLSFEVAASADLAAMARGIFLKAGDVVSASIDGIGTLSNSVVAEKL